MLSTKNGVVWKSSRKVDLALPQISEFDALKRFTNLTLPTLKPNECIAGLILQGAKKPNECLAFGKRCTPEHLARRHHGVE